MIFKKVLTYAKEYDIMCKANLFTAFSGCVRMYVKDLEIGRLLDFYGSTLPEDQRELLSAYYFEDLSLSEISDMHGLTRQGVRAAIKRGEKHLMFLEERLGLCESHTVMEKKLASAVKTMRDVAAKLEDTGDTRNAEKLRSAAEKTEAVIDSNT